MCSRKIRSYLSAVEMSGRGKVNKTSKWQKHGGQVFIRAQVYIKVEMNYVKK